MNITVEGKDLYQQFNMITQNIIVLITNIR